MFTTSSGIDTLLYLGAGVCLARIASIWLEHLYQKNNHLKSHPHASDNRLLREAIFTLGFFLPILFIPAESTGELVWKSFFCFFMIMISYTDWKQQLIFDQHLLLCTGIGILPLLYTPALLPEHLLAAIAASLCFLLLSILTHGGIGGGDIKLLFVLGIWLKGQHLYEVILIGFLLGGLLALLLLLGCHKTRKDFMPYGPCFALTAVFFI